MPTPRTDRVLGPDILVWTVSIFPKYPRAFVLRTLPAEEGQAGGRRVEAPPHGSDRNVAPDYFETIVAQHYVVSADGKFDNPDVDTLKMISAARPDDDFTVHLTYPLDEFNVPKIGRSVEKFFAAERKSGRGYKVVTRSSGELSVRVALA